MRPPPRRPTAHIFYRFLISYVAVLVLPIVILGVFGYASISRSVREQATSLATNRLATIRATLDDAIQTLHLRAVMISEDDLIVRVSAMVPDIDPDRLDPEYRQQIRRVLSVSNVTNRLVSDIMLYFKNDDLFIGTMGEFSRDEFLDVVMQPPPELRPQAQELLVVPYGHPPVVRTLEFTRYATPIRRTVFLFSMPFKSRISRAALLCFIDPANIRELVKQKRGSYEEALFVIDPQDTLITGNAELSRDLGNHLSFSSLGLEDEEFGVRVVGRHLITYTESRFTGWRYANVVSVHSALAPVRRIRNWYYIYAGLSIVFGLALSYFFSARNVDPIQEIIGTITGSRNSRPPEIIDFEFIKHSYTLLSDEKIELERRLRGMYVSQIFTGEVEDIEEVSALLERANLPIPDGPTRSAIVEISAVEPAGILSTKPHGEAYLTKRFMLSKRLQELLSSRYERCVAFELEHDSIGMVLSRPRRREQDLPSNEIDTIGPVIEQLEGELELMLTVGLSRPYTEATQFKRAYREAQAAVHQRVLLSGSAVFQYRSSHEHRGDYFFPSTFENHLRNRVQAGDWSSVRALIDEVLEENIVRRAVGTDMTDVALANFGLVFERLREEIHLPREVGFDFSAFVAKDLHQKIRHVRDAYEGLCRTVITLRDDRRHGLAEELHDHVMSRLTDPNLTLSGVAEEFGFTTVYLSRFFKENVGQKFTDFVNSHRAAMVKEMLDAGETNLHDAGKQAGFTTDITCRRVFKRHIGVLPSEYRDKVAQQ